MKKTNWNKIKSEYIAGTISQRDLAKKHGISYYSMAKRASADKWTEQKNEYQSKTTEKALQKASEKAAERDADIILSMRTSADKLVKKIDEQIDALGQTIISEDGAAIDRTRSVRNMTAALKEILSVARDLYNLPSMIEQTNIDIAKARLQIESRKAGTDEGADQGGVVELAKVLDDA